MTRRVVQRLEALERRGGRHDRLMAHEDALALMEKERPPAECVDKFSVRELDEVFALLTGRSRAPEAAP